MLSSLNLLQVKMKGSLVIPWSTLPMPSVLVQLAAIGNNLVVQFLERAVSLGWRMLMDICSV